ncbi:MAG: aminodeoxychorismate/anthranilate synthase component II [Bacteroidales bacterium]|nr:aminodeoxychorismate/anthranilate synthase component II [Bacteroidales bacterium]
MNLLIINNYDSFTYNIAHIVRNHPQVKLQIITANDLTPDKVGQFDKIIFSPGPDLPFPGDTMSIVTDRYKESKSILGICLGLQAIVLFFGGKLRHLEEVNHGRTKLISTTKIPSVLFNEIPDQFEAGLYHSWITDTSLLPECLSVTALSVENRIMAIKHNLYDIEAVQFHPESIMTPFGKKMLYNWIEA